MKIAISNHQSAFGFGENAFTPLIVIFLLTAES
jgi:hypothetical protein